MPATIKTRVEDNSKEWAENLKQNFAAAGISADQIGDKLVEVGKELDGRKAEAYRKSVKALADELDGTAEEARQAAAALKKVADEKLDTERWEKFHAKVGTAFMAMKIGAEIVKKTYETIRWLGENGSESMQQLQKSFEGVGKAALDVANDPAISKFIGDIADGITDRVVPAIKSIPDYWRGTQDAISTSITSVGEFIGVFHEGTTEIIGEMRRAQDEADAIAKHQAELKANAAAVVKVIATEAKRRADVEQAAAVAKVDNLVTLADLERQELARIRALVAAGKASEEERTASAKRLQLIFDRQRQIRDEQDRAEQDARQVAAEDERKLWDEQAAAEDKAMEERRQAFKANSERILAEQEKAAAERVKLIEKEAQAKKEALAKAAENQSGNARDLLASQDPRQIARQIAQQRTNAAREKFRAEHQQDYDTAKDMGDTKYLRQLERQQQIEGERAGRSGIRDFMAGKIDAVEVLDAQSTLANNVINQGERTGQLGRQQAEGLKEASKVLIQQQQQIQATADDVAQTKEILKALLGRGLNNNRRAQATGNGR